MEQSSQYDRSESADVRCPRQFRKLSRNDEKKRVDIEKLKEDAQKVFHDEIEEVKETLKDEHEEREVVLKYLEDEFEAIIRYINKIPCEMEMLENKYLQQVQQICCMECDEERDELIGYLHDDYTEGVKKLMAGAKANHRCGFAATLRIPLSRRSKQLLMLASKKKHSLTTPHDMFHLMELKNKGVDFSQNPKYVTNKILPSTEPKLKITSTYTDGDGEYQEIVAGPVPVTDINAWNPRTKRRISQTIKSKMELLPAQDIASKQQELENFNINLPDTSPGINDESHYNFDVVIDDIKTENYFQARGSQMPDWFPGYYTVFPEEKSIHKAESPRQVLRKANTVMK